MVSERSAYRHTFTYIVLLASLAWAVFVVIRYLGVDDNFLPNLIHVHVTLRRLLILSGIFLFCALFGYTWGQSFRRKIIIGGLSLIAISIVAFMFKSTIQSTLFKLNNLNDGVQASLVVAVGASVGVGFGVGTRISHRSVTLGFLVAAFFLPILFTALCAGEVGSLLALGWIFLISEALGTLALRWLNRFIKVPSVFIDRAGLVSIAVGLSILILATLGLGLIGGISATGILLLLLLLSVLCFQQMKSSLKRLSRLNWGQPIALSEFEWGGIAMLATLFLIYWIDTLAPEVGSDAIGLRTAAPAIWLRDGIIRPLPEMLGTYSLFAAEMLHLVIMPLTGFIAAKVVQFGLSLLLVISAYMQIFEARHRKEAALLLFAFWGGTLIWWQMIWGFVDLSQTFFYVACILALRFWLDEPESPIWLVAAGITGATATTIKQNGIAALISVEMIVLGVTLYRSHSFKKAIENSLYLGLPVLICLFPWILRSYLLTQNPVFPFANQIFKSSLYPLQLAGLVGVDLSFSNLIRVPWDIFFHPTRFQSFATYHPLMLALALLGFTGLVWVSSRKDWLWFVAGVLASLAWLVTEQNLRYSLFAIYLLVLASSIGLMKWQERFPHWVQRSLFQMLLLTGFVWGFGMQATRPSFWMQGTVSGPAFPSKVVFGEQTRSEYLTSLPTYFCAEWLNQHYGQNARVWQLPPLRDNLYFEAPASVLPASILPITQPLTEILTGEAGNNASVYQRLRAAGYTHLVYDIALMPWLSQVPESGRVGLLGPGFEAAYLKLECADRGLRLYKLRQTPMPANIVLPSQPDLLENSGLEILNTDGSPLNWNLSGKGMALRSDGNTILRLQKGATISQTIPIDDEVLYEISLDQRAASSGSSATLQISWLDSSGGLRLFYLGSLNPTEDFNSYRFLQTAPLRAQTAMIYISGNKIEIDNITVRPISAQAQIP